MHYSYEHLRDKLCLMVMEIMPRYKRCWIKQLEFQIKEGNCVFHMKARRPWSQDVFCWLWSLYFLSTGRWELHSEGLQKHFLFAEINKTELYLASFS